jgi:hypothetical protein
MAIRDRPVNRLAPGDPPFGRRSRWSTPLRTMLALPTRRRDGLTAADGRSGVAAGHIVVSIGREWPRRGHWPDGT